MDNTEIVVVVSGAAGPVGRAFLDAFVAQGCACAGISRRPIESSCPIVIADLADPEQTRLALDTLDITTYKKVVFVHTVGEFVFEAEGVPENDKDGDGINDNVRRSNVDTFSNVVKALTAKVADCQQLNVANIGSISDQFGIPWWFSYSESKNMVRRIMRELVAEEKLTYCVSLNVSTVQTDKESALRPCADTTYWLSVQELAEMAMPYILCCATGYREVSLYKTMPGFDPNQYYLDHEVIRKRWLREMGRE